VSSSSSSNTSSLWIRLPLTQEQAVNELGSLRLEGASGGYDRTVAIASNFQANPDHDTVDVHFDSVPTKDNYSLSFIAADGTASAIVSGVPFANLKDNSPPGT
jgi:hypothetical protein